MTPQAWYNNNVGKAIMVPGAKPSEAGQCLVAMDSYLHDVYNRPYIYTPAAINVWNNSLLDVLGFMKIPRGQPILAGDFVFYDARVGAKEGHVSIVSRDGGTLGGFWAYDSNWGGAKYNNTQGFPTLHEVFHADVYNNYIVGYYRLNAGKGAEVNQGEEEMINDTDAEFWRWQITGKYIRGRVMSRDEFRAAAVGKSWLRALEILDDDVEANITQTTQEVGQVAIRDKWEQQINDLRAQLATRTNIDLTTLQPAEASLLVKLAAFFGLGK